jgi:2-polyprenyl-3-methyl-5-hydroxy-6-metoxy-1,4-benzoquinol methylase
MMADLPCDAAVLDAGSGWGMSTEMMAFCGAAVTAVDINPLFVELVRRRAERLGLPVTAVCSPFDAFDTDRRFDLLFFY